MKNLFLRIFISFVVFFETTSLIAKTKVDIIFVMDTSGSLDNEAPALISATQTVSQDLASIYDLDTKLWSITNSFDFSRKGFDSSVINEIPNHTTNQYEDWGPATYDIATQYSGWRTDTIKIVVPISDEGPEDGDGLYQNDRDAIDRARTALDATNIYAVPIIAQSWNGNAYQDTLYRDYGLILSDKAIKTGSGDLVAQFKTIIADIVAEASGTSLGSVSAEFKENITGGKLVIDAKGASKYDVVIKFDGTEIINTTTTDSVVSITYPSGYDDTVSHVLDINYTAYAIDVNGQVLEQKNKAFTYNTTLLAKTFVSNYEEARVGTVAKEPIYLSAKHTTDYQVKSTSSVADPVDISSGNFEFSHSDLVVSTAGIPLIIKRSYNSLKPIRGWKFNLISSMDISDINNIKVTWSGGSSKDTFVKAKEGWISLYSTDTLTTESGAYVITKSSGNKYKFDTNGKLIAITNKQNMGLVFEYSGSTMLVKDNFGTVLATITLNGSLITSIVDGAGNSISYTYNGENLTSYTNRNGDVESYEYSGDLITAVKGADGKAYVTNTYDAQGRVTSQFDGRGNETTFVYYGDLSNMVVEKVEVTYADGVTRTHTFNLLLPTSIEGSGTTVAFEYDANNKVKTITDTNGKVWSYERNGAGLVTKSTDPQGNTMLYEYDAHNNIISNTNALGQKVFFEYDSNDNLIKATDADGQVTAYEYNANNQIIKITNTLGNEVTYSYNGKGQVEKVTLPNGATTTYAYNALGNVETITDALGRVVKYEYDKEGKVTKVINPMNYATLMEYNAFGDLIKVTDAKNRTVTMEYNVDGLLTKTTLVDGTTVETTYDVLGRVIAIKDVLGRESKREYDDFGRVSKIIDPKGNEFLLEYDNVGNVVKVTDAKGNDVETTYDELYRPFKTLDANGVEVATTSYNALSQPTKVEDATGRTIEFSYDTLNRLQRSTLSGSIKAEAIYDALGRITQTTDPKGATNAYAYDSMGNLVKEINPLGKETVYNYDILGRVTSTLTPNGVTSTFTYDGLDRVVKISQAKGTETAVTTYTYDEVGNLLTVTDKEGTVTYTYNVNDQIATRTDIYGNTVSYGYDQAKRLTTLTYPNGKEVHYDYDENNNLVKVTDWANRETNYEYNNNGDLIKAIYVNGAYSTYSYDNNSRLVSLSNYDKNGKLISANELTRNEIGDITDNKETNPATVDLSKVKNFNFEVNAFNQITKSDEGDFVYDDNGNLLSYKYDGKTITLEYDLSDRLTKATIGSDVYSYTYDAEGNRVAVNGKRYLVDNVMGLSKPLAELDGGAISHYYIWTNGLGYSVDSSDEVLVYLFDYQGNTHAILDMNNQTKASYRYTAYGAVISADSGLDNPFKYLGQHGIISDSSALYYVRARYYSPELSRWTQADLKRGSIINPLSINRYVLNEGDVVNYVDVSGYLKEKKTAIQSYDTSVENYLVDTATKRLNAKIDGNKFAYYMYTAELTGESLLSAVGELFVRPSVSCTSATVEGGWSMDSGLSCADVAITLGTAGLSKGVTTAGTKTIEKVAPKAIGGVSYMNMFKKVDNFYVIGSDFIQFNKNAILNSVKEGFSTSASRGIQGGKIEIAKLYERAFVGGEEAIRITVKEGTNIITNIGNGRHTLLEALQSGYKGEIPVMINYMK
jgi:RHS repeat-associated protein